MVSRRTGISQARLSQLSTNTATNLRAKEVYLIALAIDTAPCDLLEVVCSDLRLKSDSI